MEEGGEAEEDDSDHGDTMLTDSYLDTYELSPPSVSSFHKSTTYDKISEEWKNILL